MYVLLIILLAVVVTISCSIDFHPDRNKKAVKGLGTTGKKGKAMASFIEIYPGFKLVVNIISLFAIVWISCLSALEWSLLSGCFIALVVVSLSQLLGARLSTVTDQLIIRYIEPLAHYLAWAGSFSSMTLTRESDPIDDIDELVKAIRSSHVDCSIQIAIEHAIKIRELPINKIATKWSEVKKLGYKDKLTPIAIDELFKSHQKVFPVIRNDSDDVVGLLHLSDVQAIGQTEAKILDSMHRNFITCEYDLLASEVLRLMAESETTVAVITKKQKTVGLVNMDDIMSVEPLCRPQF